MPKLRTGLTWIALGALLAWPLGVAATSPLLEWRGPAYVAGGFAGVAGLALLLVQPLLAGGLLPGLAAPRARRAHRWVGGAVVAAVAVHVAGLWLTSPPDVIDVLLLRSPTPFGVWGALALWALVVAAGLGALRGRLGLRPRTFRRVHAGVASAAVLGTAAHALLIEGTMGTLSKAVLCLLAVGAAGWVLAGALATGRRAR